MFACSEPACRLFLYQWTDPYTLPTLNARTLPPHFRTRLVRLNAVAVCLCVCRSSLQQQLDGLRNSFEYISDYVNSYGLQDLAGKRTPALGPLPIDSPRG